MKFFLRVLDIGTWLVSFECNNRFVDVDEDGCGRGVDCMKNQNYVLPYWIQSIQQVHGKSVYEGEAKLQAESVRD